MMHTLQKLYEREIQEIVTAANRLAMLGYVASHGGNLSAHIEENVVLITPTKVPKRDIVFEDICIVTLQGGTLYAAEGRKPTSELPFHLRIFQRRPDLRAIVHAHPPVLTGFAITGDNTLCLPFLPEPAIEVGPMVMVPYALSGSDALAKAFDSVLDDSNGFLMENHGALMTNGEGVLRAVDLLEMMEGAAKSALVAKFLGGFKPLRDQDVDELEKGLVARGLPMPGKPGKNATLRDVFS